MMPTGQDYLDSQFLEMRARVLALAADMDRIERAAGGAALLESEPRLQKLRRAIKTLLDERTNRAEQVQLIFSDTTEFPQSAIQNLKAQIINSM